MYRVGPSVAPRGVCLPLALELGLHVPVSRRQASGKRSRAALDTVSQPSPQQHTHKHSGKDRLGYVHKLYLTEALAFELKFRIFLTF